MFYEIPWEVVHIVLHKFCPYKCWICWKKCFCFDCSDITQMKIKYVLAAVNDKSSLMKCSHKETRTFMHISLRNKKITQKEK